VLTRTEGIVLKTQKYGEADLIVTYLTSDRGIIKAFAKSPRKTKSRFGSSLEPLTHAKISLWGKEQSAMPKITQSDIINSFHQIREHYQDFVNTSKLVEILISLTPQDTPNKKLFAFFLNILHFTTSSDPATRYALHLITQVRLLAMIGYAPRLRSCGRCGGDSLDFYPDAGTTLCKKCSISPAGKGQPYIRINNRVIHFYTHTIEWPINISQRLKPGSDTISELSVILDRHLNYLLSKKLLSSGFTARRTVRS
jgi:DNA repair protein RecO (recombination protein O)